MFVGLCIGFAVGVGVGLAAVPVLRYLFSWGYYP
jgi:hypothetical protein